MTQLELGEKRPMTEQSVDQKELEWERTEEDVSFTYEVSDEALEAAAVTMAGGVKSQGTRRCPMC